MSQKKAFPLYFGLGLALVLAVVLAAPAASDIIIIAEPSCDTCDCYWSSDCSDGQTCGDYFKCTRSGKLDGTCKKRDGVAPWSAGDLLEVAGAVDDRFDAFLMVSGDDVGGFIESAAEYIEKAQNRRLTALGHSAVLTLVEDVLDLSVGFDVVTAESGARCSEVEPLPGFRGDHHNLTESQAMIRAMREAVASAIRGNDPSLAEGPIRTFWENYPDYEPDHSGRCYNHGHHDFPYLNGLDCQLSEVVKVLELYLPAT